MTTSTDIRGLLFAACVGACTSLAHADPVTTAFTYQGELASNGTIVDGIFDLRFRLYDALSGGNTIGPALCYNNINVVSGRFSVPVDFGQQFFGQSRFLEIDVRAGAGLTCANTAGFTTLAPRTELSAAPHAIFSQFSGLASNTTQLNGQPAGFYTNAANLTGSLPPTAITGSFPATVAFTNAGNQFAGAFNGAATGTFTGNGAALNQLNATSVSSGILSPSRGGTGTSIATATTGSVLKWNGSAWAADTDLNFSPIIGSGLALVSNTLSIPTSGVTALMIGTDAVTGTKVLNGSLSKNDLAVDITFFSYMSSDSMYTVQGRYVFGPSASTDPIPDYTLVVKGTAQVQDDLIVNGAITTDPQTRTKVISPLAFSPQSNTTGYFRAGNGMYGTDVGFNPRFDASLDLPDGATIVSVTFWYTDTTNTNIDFGVGFQDFSLGGATSCGPDVSSSGNGAATRSITFLPASHQTVNHAAGMHYLTASWQVPATPSSMQIEGAVVTYTTSGAVP